MGNRTSFWVFIMFFFLKSLRKFSNLGSFLLKNTYFFAFIYCLCQRWRERWRKGKKGRTLAIAHIRRAEDNFLKSVLLPCGPGDWLIRPGASVLTCWLSCLTFPETYTFCISSNSFLKALFFMFKYVCICHIRAGAQEEQKRFSESEVAGCCQLPDVDSGSPPWVLCKSRKCT